MYRLTDYLYFEEKFNHCIIIISIIAIIIAIIAIIIAIIIAVIIAIIQCIIDKHQKILPNIKIRQINSIQHN